MHNIHPKSLLLVAIASATLAACGGAPKQIDSLEQLRIDYESASANATIVRHAPEELDNARDSLAAADRLWREKEDRELIDHHVYLANQKLEVAHLVSQTNEMDSQLEGMAIKRREVALDIREAELEKARAQAEELKQQMADLQAEQTERGMMLTLGDVLFASNEAALAPGASRKMDRIAEFLRKYPERRALIEGHTDDRGEADYNLNLSRERALAVKKALMMRGIHHTRLSIAGLGETMPVASNASASGRQENRRVELIFPDSHLQVSATDG